MIKVAVIDSGLNLERKEFYQFNIQEVEISNITVPGKDEIGHGTAVTYIIGKGTKNVQIYSFKIFDNEPYADEERLLKTLEYIYENMDMDIIHISNGIVVPSQYKKLKSVCDRLTSGGTIIVAAGDNEGINAFPACFDNVIGVSWANLYNTQSYIYIKNSNINIRGYGGVQRLPWTNNTYKNVSGSSFAAPYITCRIVNYMQSGIKKYEDINEQLKKDASKVQVFTHMKKNKLHDMQINVREIQKSIVFPFNKEIEVLLENIDLCNFKVIGVYDTPYSRKVNQEINASNGFKAHIDSIFDLNWCDDFDTVILGHCEIVNSLLKKNIHKYFLEYCYIYNKNLYCFDDIGEDYRDEIQNLESKGLIVSYPHLSNEEIEINTYGGLYQTACPVVAVVGTDSRQGKFSLQLSIRRRLSKMGYKVGMIGTEPSAGLLGADVVYPCGYGTSLNLESEKEIFYINNEISKLYDNDIVILGTQSNTVPYSFGNIGFYPLRNNNILLGGQPDGVILVVNYNEDEEYLKRTINYIENYFEYKVIAISIFPFSIEKDWVIKRNEKNSVTEQQLRDYKSYISEKYKIPAFINKMEDEQLTETLINFFVEE